VATLSQGPLVVIACQTQGADSPQCQYAAMGITAGYFSDVIGSEQALQASAQQVQSVAQQGLTELSFASSILNLPNADNPAGWTLGTYGGQTNSPLSGLTFNPQQTLVQLSGYNNVTVPMEIEQISPTVIRLRNENYQYLQIDLNDPLLNNQVARAIDAVTGLPPGEVPGALYQYMSQYVSPNLSQYDEVMHTAAQAGTPINLSENIANRNVVCLERHCFLNLVNQVLNPNTVGLDVFISNSESVAGHMTNSLLSKDPLIRLQQFNGTLFLDTESIGLIQRINLFGQ